MNFNLTVWFTRGEFLNLAQSTLSSLRSSVELSQRKLFFVCFEELAEVNRFGDFTGRVFCKTHAEEIFMERERGVYRLSVQDKITALLSTVRYS